MEQQIPDRAADQCQLVTLFGEQSTKFDGFGPYFEIQWAPSRVRRFFCPTSIPLPHLHTGLSKVENMITPADLARMLGQTPDSADSHTQDHLLYTSETPHHSADSGDSSDVGGTASHSTNQAVHQDEVDAVPTAQHSGVPGTPATPATPEPSESEISDAASDMPAPKPMMPTPATVFGMHATVTIATTSGTIEGLSLIHI